MQIELQNEPVAAETSSSTSAPVARAQQRLRILHVVPQLSMGGTEHGILNVMKQLGEFEHHVCGVRGVDPGFAKLMNLNGNAHSAGSAEPGFQFPLFRLLKIIRSCRPHIVHTRNYGSLECILAARLAGVPIVIHTEEGYELGLLQGLPLKRRVISRAFYTMTDALFTVAGSLQTFHTRQSWLGQGRMRVIFNGVDTDKFSPRPEIAARIRAEFGIPLDRFVVGTVGRLVAIKDYGTLLQAAELLAAKETNIHVVIVGSGPEQEKLQAQANASSALDGRVTFIGSTPRVPEVLNAMDVFALPSICEGLSYTILEAMSSGLPVVVTHAGGSPELVDDNRSGFLFAVRDIPAFVQILQRLADNPEMRREFGEVGRSRALELFSIKKMMRSYRDLYFELAARRGLVKGS